MSSLAAFINSDSLSFLFSSFFLLMYSFVAYMQAIQEVFVAEEQVRDMGNEARVKANIRAKTDRALGAAKQKNQELITQLIAEERARRSIEASLQNA